jgi:hypothetical protein
MGGKLCRKYWPRKTSYTNIEAEQKKQQKKQNSSRKSNENSGDDIDEFLNGYVSEPSSNEIEQSLDRYWTSLNERSDMNMMYNTSLPSISEQRPIAIRGVYVDRRGEEPTPVVLPRLVIEQRTNRPELVDMDQEIIVRRQNISEF